MKLEAAMIAWNPRTDEIDVVPWPDTARTSRALRYTVGACDAEMHAAAPDRRLALLFIHFNTITVRDLVPVQAAHRAFLKIDEYRHAIAPDQQGAAA